MKRTVVAFDSGPQQVLGSPAVKVGDYVFLGGQMAVDRESGLLPEVRRQPATDIPTIASRHQSDYILDRSINILKAAGSSLDSACASTNSAHIRERLPPISKRARAGSKPPSARPARMSRSTICWRRARCAACN